MDEYHLKLLLFRERVKDLCLTSAECAHLAPPPVPDAQDDPIAAEVFKEAVAILRMEATLRPGFAQMLQAAVFAPAPVNPEAAPAEAKGGQ